MKNISLFVFSILCIACASEPYIFESFTVAFSTPEGNKIWVREVRFDDKWNVPVGSMSCCWDSAGASSSVYNKSMPKLVYVEWLDESERKIYKATLEYDEEQLGRAKDLPSYTVKSNKAELRGVYLIIGFKEEGKVYSWLSNARSDKNKTGRVKYLVGQARATGEPWIPPAK